jgi:hypothetical protein
MQVGLKKNLSTGLFPPAASKIGNKYLSFRAILVKLNSLDIRFEFPIIWEILRWTL